MQSTPDQMEEQSGNIWVEILQFPSTLTLYQTDASSFLGVDLIKRLLMMQTAIILRKILENTFQISCSETSMHSCAICRIFL